MITNEAQALRDYLNKEVSAQCELSGNYAEEWLKISRILGILAVRQGFEPWRRLPAYTRSRRAPSTTRPPHHPEGAEYSQDG